MPTDIDEITLILSGVKILQDLDVEIIQEIARHTQTMHFKKDEMLVKAGQKGTRLFVICDGKVEVQIPDDQGDIKSRILLKKGEIIGEMSLLI
ncbi:MAG: CRP-like cAMP-binding protein, partial [Gammaproteobacteria bacterium]